MKKHPYCAEKNQNNTIDKEEADKKFFRKAFGLNVKEMTEEQKNILREFIQPSRLSWLNYIWMAFFLLAVYYLIKLDFASVGFYVMFGAIIMFANFFICRQIAFRKYKKTVTNSEYASFIAGNSLLIYFLVRYGKLIQGLVVIIGIIYLFFNWRIGLSVFLFGTNILAPFSFYLQGKVKIRWGLLAFFFVSMIAIWIIFPPQ